MKYLGRGRSLIERDLERGKQYKFEAERIVPAIYRPYVRRFLYFSPQLNEMPNLMPRYFGTAGKLRNQAIVFTDPTAQKPFMSLVIDICPDMHIVGAAAGGVILPLSIPDGSDGAANITDWAVSQFKKYYRAGLGKKARPITKEAIFRYVYGVLHDPLYREKYALNLKREFPRIPFHADFWGWSDWGQELIRLHVGYESVSPWKLKRKDVEDERVRKAGMGPKSVLRAEKEAGRIIVDAETSLESIPEEAWNYRLGNRSALEWILDQYRERAPKDPTIREKFNTYRFADYKEKVIDLLVRVTTVSVETQRIVEEMKKAPR